MRKDLPHLTPRRLSTQGSWLRGFSPRLRRRMQSAYRKQGMCWFGPLVIRRARLVFWYRDRLDPQCARPCAGPSMFRQARVPFAGNLRVSPAPPCALPAVWGSAGCPKVAPPAAPLDVRAARVAGLFATHDTSADRRQQAAAGVPTPGAAISTSTSTGTSTSTSRNATVAVIRTAARSPAPTMAQDTIRALTDAVRVGVVCSSRLMVANSSCQLASISGCAACSIS